MSMEIIPHPAGPALPALIAGQGTHNPSCLSSTAHTTPEPPRAHSPSVLPGPHKPIPLAHPFNLPLQVRHSNPIVPASAANTGGFVQVAVSNARRAKFLLLPSNSQASLSEDKFVPIEINCPSVIL